MCGKYPIIFTTKYGRFMGHGNLQSSIIEGFCWNLINGTRSENNLKFRISPASVNDVGGMTLHSYCDIIPDAIFVAIGNCGLISRYTESFVNFTVNFQVNDCRMIPIVIPPLNQVDEIVCIVNELIRLTNKSTNELKSNQFIERIQHLEEYLNQAIEDLYLIR